MILLSAIESHNNPAQKLIDRWAIPDDRAYAALKKNPGPQHNSLLARAVLRCLLSNSGHDGKVPISIRENGKPYIESGPHISISHSRDMVACGLCAGFPLGIDIEYHRLRDFAKLAAYAFGPGENKTVAVDGISAFYRIWTMREAISKVLGAGMFSAMNGKDMDLIRWQVFSASTCENYSLGLAIENSGISLKDNLKWIDATQ